MQTKIKTENRRAAKTNPKPLLLNVKKFYRKDGGFVVLHQKPYFPLF